MATTYYCSYCGKETEIIAAHLVSQIFVDGTVRKPTKKEKQSLRLAKWHSYRGTLMQCPGSGKSALEGSPTEVNPYSFLKESN